MSRNFDGIDDVAALTAAQTLGNDLFFAALFDADTQGEENAGILIEQSHTKGPDFPRFGLRWNEAAGSKKLCVWADHVTTRGHWEMTTGFATLPGWKWAGASYNGTNVATHPTLYVWDGTTFSVLTNGAGLTRISTPVGTWATDAQAIRVGNNSNGTDSWDGRIASAIMVKRLPTESEVRELFLKGPITMLRDMHCWWDFMLDTGGTVYDRSGNGRHGTISGAVFSADNPSMLQMAGSMITA